MNDLCGRVAALITFRPLVLFGFVSVTAFLLFSLLLSYHLSFFYHALYPKGIRISIHRFAGKNVSRLVTPRSFPARLPAPQEHSLQNADHTGSGRATAHTASLTHDAVSFRVQTRATCKIILLTSARVTAQHNRFGRGLGEE